MESETEKDNERRFFTAVSWRVHVAAHELIHNSGDHKM